MMSKKYSKAQASSGKIVAARSGLGLGFGSGLSSSSLLSYAAEPPDLALISDANLVVVFKNLAKKDGTTKTKALEELQGYIQSPERNQGGVEDAVLQAWVKYYPRLSIDSDRRVRQYSHILQGRLSVACGKRTAHYLPDVAGPWLAGLYDNDRATSRGAQEALKLVFPTSEKLHSLRRIYHESIVQYCRDAILNETIHTLSDERSISPDDAETKYTRVISSRIMLISSLLADMDPVEISKHQHAYDELLDSKRFWDFSHHKDPSIRRSMYRLLKVCLDKSPNTLSKDFETISACFVHKSLGIEQIGSSTDFLESLLMLTTNYPTVWTDHYRSKKPALDRLRHFLSRGSQAGTTQFWRLLAQLLQEIPIIPQEFQSTAGILRALHSGVTSKDEPRPNLEAAWTTYLDTVQYRSQSLPTEAQIDILKEFVLPVVEQYIKPNPSNVQWILPSTSQSATLLRKAIRLLGEVLQDAWSNISASLIADMKASSPEQSRAFESSQEAIAVEGERWASIQAMAIEESPDTSQFLQVASQVFEEAMSLLQSRNGKPHAAASVIESALKHGASFLEHNEMISNRLSSFLLQDMPALISGGTPSSAKLVRLLMLCKAIEGFHSAWSKTLRDLINGNSVDDENLQKKLDEVLGYMLCSPEAPQQDLAQDLELQNFLVRRFTGSIVNEQFSADDSLIQQILRHKCAVLSSESMEKILLDITESLSNPGQALGAIRGLRALQDSNREALSKFVETSAGSTLASNVLLLSESSDEEIAVEAANLCASLMTVRTSGSQSLVFNIISKGLDEASPGSVSVENLIDLAQKLWEETEKDRTHAAKMLIPNALAMRNALAPLLSTGPQYDLSITSPLSGAVYLIDTTQPTRRVQEWDASGLSIFLRVAFYTCQLLSKTNVFDYLDQNHRIDVLQFLELAVQLVNEEVTLGAVRGLFASDAEAEVLEFLPEVHSLVHRWLEASTEWWQSSPQQSESSLVAGTMKNLFDSAANSYSAAYYYALAYSALLRELVELHGRPATMNEVTLESMFSTLRRNDNDVRFISFLVAVQQFLAKSEELLGMLNGLISNIAGLDAEEDPRKALRQLVFLNAILQNEKAPIERVAKQRIVFFVQHITQWAANPHLQLPIQTESLKALSSVIGHMKDMYGSHWADILRATLELWERPPAKTDGWLSLLHASLKLFGTLRSLSEEEDANDDLLDAWNERQPAAGEELVSVLKSLGAGRNDAHQPQRIVNELLARQISKTRLRSYEDLSELFSLIQAQSESIQKTAFAILDVQIPAKQEQVSFDAALDKKAARLPEELVSMILEVPFMSDLGKVDLQTEMPRALRAYLLSWLLVFDHFRNASYKVKADYSEDIKEGGYLTGLLDLLATFLGHSRGKVVDASKFDIVNYDSNLESLPEKDMQWLLVHLFYLSLKHMPSLTKSWWIECRSRQTVMSIETWTEKCFSPLIIADALESANEWANTQDASPDEQLIIKINHRAKEVAASYVVDEQTMKMVISLPGAYPLQQARVEGISRVAVEEKKWQSWLTNCRGVITFSNGSIPDGLSSWRKNVVGALKGQTECAICYSIIGADRQLPSKRCNTCKNLFHSSCLFKWFKSSNASTCPLCRNPFNYG